MKKNIAILLILLLILFLMHWIGANGYREFNSKKSNVKNIRIYDKKLTRKLMASSSEDSTKRLTMEEALEKSLLKNITEKTEVDEFINCFQPKYLNFKIDNCRCSGDYSILFEYQNGTEFQFALSHYSAIKMPEYRDWPVGFEAYLWLRKKGVIVPSQ